MKTVLRLVALLLLLPGALRAEQTLGTVNGEPVTPEVFRESLAEAPAALRQKGGEALRQFVVDHLTVSTALVAAGRKAGIEESEPFQNLMRQYHDYALREIYLQQKVSERLDDKDVKALYAERYPPGGGEEEVRARHILLPSQADAEAVIALLDKGENFEDLAREKSAGPSRAEGGDLGYFRYGTMVKSFADAAFRIPPGTYSKTPVETEFGWHVIKVEDKRTVTPPAYETVKEALRQELATALRQKIIAETVAAADVKLDDAALKQQPLTLE